VLIAANGGLGLTANSSLGAPGNGLTVAAFIGAGNGFVATLYDQAGAANMTQATAANQPQLILSGFGTLPIIRFNNASATSMASASVPTVAQPFSMACLAKRTAVLSTFDSMLESNGGNTGLLFSVSGTFLVYAGTQANLSQTDNAMHAFQGLFNGASSTGVVDGTSTASSSGVNAWQTFAGIGSNFGQPFTGDWGEGGHWSGLFSGAQITSMNSNMHTYWGF
jgi:hypothetical protein